MNREIEEFIGYLTDVRRASPETVRAYAGDLKQLANFAAAYDPNRQITEFSALDLRHFLAYLRDRGVGPRSLARKVSALKRFYKFLRERGITAGNAAAALKTPKFPKSLPTFLKKEEAAAILDGVALKAQTPRPDGVKKKTAAEARATATRDWAVLELLYGAGIRVGELVKLDVNDVDLRAEVVTVTGKGDKMRVVPTGSKAAEAVGTYLTYRPALARDRDEKALFLNRWGGRLSARSVHRLVKRTAGPGVTPHSWRHTFATHLMDAGADLETVRELLGHATIATTAIYTHVTTSRLRETYDRFHPHARRQARPQKGKRGK